LNWAEQHSRFSVLGKTGKGGERAKRTGRAGVGGSGDTRYGLRGWE